IIHYPALDARRGFRRTSRFPQPVGIPPPPADPLHGTGRLISLNIKPLCLADRFSRHGQRNAPTNSSAKTAAMDAKIHPQSSHENTEPKARATSSHPSSTIVTVWKINSM